MALQCPLPHRKRQIQRMLRCLPHMQTGYPAGQKQLVFLPSFAVQGEDTILRGSISGMNFHAFLRGGAVCTAALAALFCTPLTCFADESSTAAESAADPDEDPEIKTYTSGDYTYSVLVDADDDKHRAARIESYSGSETEIEIPAELDDLQVVSLGDYAFAGASDVTKFTLPASVTEIGNYTFAACTSLMEYAVAEDNPYFEAKDGILYADAGESLMRYPIGLKPTDYVVPDGILRIGNVAFADRSSLTSVTFPDELNYIGIAAFSDCTGLTEVVIPDGVELISDFAFNSCKNLRSVTLPDGLREIGAAAFSATALESVTLPESLIVIGEQAFIATPMTEITIPGSVSDIGYTALGWDVKPDGQIYCKPDFIVRGYANSAAEDYVKGTEYENVCKFEPLNEPAPQNADEGDTETEPEKKNTGAVKAIGITTCGAAILGIIAAAVISGKKKKHEPEQKDTPEKNDAPEQKDTPEKDDVPEQPDTAEEEEAPDDEA